MTNFKKGDEVVKVISVMGIKTVAIDRLFKVTKVSKKTGEVTIGDPNSDDEYVYRADGWEKDPVIPGCTSEIIYVEK